MSQSQVALSFDKLLDKVGEETTVTLNVKGTKELYGFDTTFNYAPALFMLENVTLNKGFARDTSYLSYIDNNGSVRIVPSLTGKAEGVTERLRFKA